MSFTLHGIPVSHGIAIGFAHLVSHTSFEVAHYVLPQNMVHGEVARYKRALEATRKELASLHANPPANAADEFAAFLDLHLMILNDEHISQAPVEMMERESCNAEWALKVQMDHLAEHFEAFEDAYLRERKMDVVQVGERILKSLLGHPGHVPPSPDHDGNVILVAHDLSPADLIQLKPHQFAGFITDLGGATSHTAIIARGLNTPCVVGLHHARQLLK